MFSLATIPRLPAKTFSSLMGGLKRWATDLAIDDAETVIDAAGRPVTSAFFAGITATGLNEIGMVYEAVDSRLSGLYTGLIHPEFDVRRAA